MTAYNVVTWQGTSGYYGVIQTASGPKYLFNKDGVFWPTIAEAAAACPENTSIYSGMVG
jgi:hypothetical protein